MSKTQVIQTGIPNLDDYFEGFRTGSLYIIGGRPASGKTAFILSIVYNLMMEQCPVGMLSLEKNHSDISWRLYDLQDKLSDLHVGDHYISILELIDAYFLLDDPAELTIDKLRDKAYQLSIDQYIKILMVDYLQLIQGQKNKSNQENEKNICSILKEIAVELDISVLLTTQLSRRTEQRKNKRPELTDLFYLSEIEESADTIMLLHRKQMENSGKSEKTKTECIIAKDRYGITRTVDLQFWESSGLFE